MSTAQVRFMMENRKDLCKPEERTRDLDNLERLRAARPLTPPAPRVCTHTWERMRRKGQGSDVDQWRCAVCGQFKARG